jgi:hypothetical protein
MTSGFHFRLAYTYPHAIDDGQDAQRGTAGYARDAVEFRGQKGRVSKTVKNSGDVGQWRVRI